MQSGVETSTTVLEGLDWSPACQSENDAHVNMAPHDATHAVFTSCGCIMLLCAQAAQAAQAVTASPLDLLMCSVCERHPIAITRVTPLKA